AVRIFGMDSDGNVSITAGGNVEQTGTIIANNGTFFVDAAGQTVNLGSTLNDFSTFRANAGTLTVTDTNGIILGASTITGDASVTSDAGISLGIGVSQSAAVSVGGTLSLDANTYSVTLNDTGN